MGQIKIDVERRSHPNLRKLARALIAIAERQAPLRSETETTAADSPEEAA
jgi:hypothetical protein